MQIPVAQIDAGNTVIMILSGGTSVFELPVTPVTLTIVSSAMTPPVATYNEVAVDAFLSGALPWSGIADVVAETLDGWRDEPVDQVESVLAADEEARARARAVVARRTGEGGSAVALSLV